MIFTAWIYIMAYNDSFLAVRVMENCVCINYDDDDLHRIMHNLCDNMHSLRIPDFSEPLISKAY